MKCECKNKTTGKQCKSNAVAGQKTCERHKSLSTKKSSSKKSSFTKKSSKAKKSTKKKSSSKAKKSTKKKSSSKAKKSTKKKSSNKKQPTYKKQSFTDLFTMKTEDDKKRGQYYVLETNSKPRKEVKVTQTNARTPQFEFDYKGKKTVVTMGLGGYDWQRIVTKLLDLEIAPKTQFNVNVKVETAHDGSIPQKSMASVKSQIKQAIKEQRDA